MFQAYICENYEEIEYLLSFVVDGVPSVGLDELRGRRT